MVYSIAWNEASPAGASTNANTLDTELQDLKKSVRERMNDLCENTWETDGNNPKTLAVSAIAGTPDVAVVYSSGNQTITSGVQLTILWNTETLDTGGFHSTSTNTGRFTIVTAAYYRITAQILTIAGANAADVTLQLHKNGSSIRSISTPVISGDNFGLYMTEIVLAAATDYYEVKIDQSSSVNMTLQGAVAGSIFQIERINGTT